MVSHHDWQRYWYKRGQRIPYKNGFFDPQHQSFLSESYSLVTIQSIYDKPCLALLGEAGLGKSTIMQQTEKELKVSIEENSYNILYCDFRLVSSEDSLNKSIFEHAIFMDWLSSDKKLYLFLDSLDEGLLQVGILTNLLADKLRNFDTSRLFLRVACRTGVFPSTFEQDLVKLWGEENVGIFQLAPLSSSNIVTACESMDINGDNFLKTIKNLQIQAFASIPVTLDILLRMYKSNQQLRNSKIQLYEQGCRILCSETSEKRFINEKTRGKVSVDKRFEIAMMIAAVTIFCNKSTISKKIYDEGKLLINDLITSAYAKYSYTYEEIEEVLGTALFTEIDQNEYGWSHLSYAEFLAARFLHSNEFTEEQVLNLILQSEDDNKRVIPQLHQTTAWIANYMDPINTAVAQKDPDVLCLSDISQFHDTQKEAFIDSLLQKFDDNYYYHRYGGEAVYRNLYHENLAKQLHNFLREKPRETHVQEMIVNIVYYCNLSELIEDLLFLIEDNIYNRINIIALHVFFRITNEDQKTLSLRLLGKITNECDIRIFEELYPEYIQVDDVLSLLKKKKFQDNRIKDGVISFIKPLNNDDLTTLLLKLYQYSIDKESERLNDILDIILIYSYDYWENEKLQEVWIDIANKRFNRLGTPILKTFYSYGSYTEFDEKFFSDFNKRLLIIESIWKNNKKISIEDIVSSKLRLVGKRDLENLVQLVGEIHNSFQRFLINLITNLFDPNNREDIEICKPLYNNHNLLSRYLDNITLYTSEAERLKIIYENSKPKSKVIIQQNPSREKLINILLEFHENPIKNWDKFIEEIYIPLDFITEFDDYSLSKSRGWNLFDEEEKQKIFKASKEFLLMHLVDKRETGFTNKSPNPVLEAIQLTWEYEKEFFQSLNNKLWSKLYKYIIDPLADYYLNGKDLFKLAYAYSPKEVTNYLLNELSKPRSIGSYGGNRHTTIRRIIYCKDDFLVNEIEKAAEKPELRLTSRQDLYKVLIQSKNKQANKYVNHIVETRYNSLTNFKRGIAAACSLMEADNGGGVSIISSILKSQEERDIRFFITTLQRYSKETRSYSFFVNWNMQELKNLYVFLHNYSDQFRETYYFNVKDWKKRIIERFLEKDNLLGLTCLAELSRLTPDCQYVQLYWEKSRTTYFRETWTAPSINELFQMIGNTKVIPITNEKQLLSAIYKSIHDYEKEVNATENPLLDQFWDNYKGKYLPKSETILSNLLKRHLSYDLKEQGLIFNREVVVFDKQGGIPGERIDIKVDGPRVNNRRERLKAYIEVKGCWNPNLDNDMQEQLVKRYMINRQCKNGIFVIGWYKCPQWTVEKDSRKPPKYSLEEARNKFRKQAEMLSIKYNVNLKAIVLDFSLK